MATEYVVTKQVNKDSTGKGLPVTPPSGSGWKLHSVFQTATGNQFAFVWERETPDPAAG